MATLVWEERAATYAVEQILAGVLAHDEEVEARVLSSSESKVLEDLLKVAIQPICNSLDLSVEFEGIAQDGEGLKTIRDAGPGADARRLMVHMMFDGPGGPSEMRLYLPNINEAGSEPEEVKCASVPEHLGAVHLEMRVELGTTQIALRELLSLEVGDVIPLGTEVGGLVHMYIEDRSIAQGTWGQVGGMLAMNLTKVDTDSFQIN